METYTQLMSQELKKANYSTTTARTKIFEILVQNPSLTMHDLCNLAVKYVDRASVYRVIEVFEEIGIVHKVYTGWKYKIELSELFSPHHHHMYCTQCHRTISFKEPSELATILHKLEAHHSFTVTSHQFELQGLCKDCRS